jgi:hypothetical protein
MACTVTRKDIQTEVKNELLDIDGTKGVPSGVFFSYNKDNPSNISEELSDSISDIKKRYKENIYGSIISTNRNEYGVSIDITPSQKLADAMTSQNEADEMIKADTQKAGVGYSQDYLFNNRRTAKNSEPVEGSNNYTEFVRYKQDRLAELESQVAQAYITLKNASFSPSTNSTDVKKRIQDISKERTKIERQLEPLTKMGENVEYMFHAIIEDVQNLEEALKSDKIFDINQVNSRLTFYESFLKGKDKNYQGDSLSEYKEYESFFNEIIGKIASLQNIAATRTEEIVREVVEQSEAVERLKENDPNLKIDSLFQAQRDINWLEQFTLGVTADRTNNTIIPQSLYRMVRNTLTRKKATIQSWSKQLKALEEKNPNLKNPDWIKEKDKDGNETGFLTNIFSPKYYETMVKYRNALSYFIKNSSDSQAYHQVVNELLLHNEVIDFTKLRIVRDLYNKNYPEYFNSSEEVVDEYEATLKKKLGPRYQETVDQILNRLSAFEQSKLEAQSSTDKYALKDLASQNLWKFNKLVGSPNLYSEIVYNDGPTSKEVFFRDFNNITFIPKYSRTAIKITNNGKSSESVKEKTGFYNNDFIEISKDKDKLEYWKLMKNISEYISSTYDQQTMGRLSYPKVQKEYAERLQQGLRNKNLKGIFLDSAKEYKSWFFERGRYKENNQTVVSNYRDGFDSEMRQLTKAYVLQGMEEGAAAKKAREEILPSYSDDFNSNMIAVAMEAALHDARVEVQPMAEASLKAFREIKDENNEDRKRAIEKLEYFYDTVILNTNQKYRGTTKIEGRSMSEGTWLNRMLALLDKIPYIERMVSKKSTYFMSDAEKRLFKELTQIKEKGSTDAEYGFKDADDVYYGQKYAKDESGHDYISHFEKIGENVESISETAYNKKFQEHIEQKISDLGLDMNLAGLINGILKTVIFKGLALSPISGIFNRIEGKHSAMIMDATGEYWPAGNMDVANNIMAFANITRLSKGKLSPIAKKKRETLEIFEVLVKQFDILQDRKNELQRSAEEASFVRELSNPFIWAVENPEYKNQGGIILSILMDTMITNPKTGEKVPMLNRDTGEFTIYDLVDGQVVLKEEFRSDANLQTFSNFKGEQAETMVLRMVDAVSRSQGNYDALDIMFIKKTIWGRAATLFMTWFAEHLNQRFGKSGDANYNLATGKRRRDGRYIEAYRANKVNSIVAMATGTAISYGIGGPFLAAAGVGALGLFAYKKFVGTIASPESIQRDANTVLELGELLKSLLVESLNYPLGMLNINSKYRVKNSSFENTTMTENDIAAMRALTRELAIALTWLGVKLAMGALTYDDDEDKESAARKRHNFIQNQMSRTINALTVYTNPHELVSDHSRVAALDVLSTVFKLGMAVVDEKQREKFGQNLLNLTPVPRILANAVMKGEAPWESGINYDTKSNMTGLPTPLKYAHKFIKNNDTNGIYYKEQDSKKRWAKMREDLKEEALDVVGNNTTQINKYITKRKKEILGKEYGKGKTKEEKLDSKIAALEKAGY